MAYRKQLRRKFTASSILTVSASLLGASLFGAGLLIALPPSGHAADECNDRIPQVEEAMQDGLSDLTTARNLLEEALHGVDAATADDSQTCNFLRNSQDSYTRARTHFVDCSDIVDSVLIRCEAPDWGGITASPELCDQRIAEIDAQLATMPDDITRFCGQ